MLTAIAARDEQALSFGLITQLVHNPQLSRATAQRLAGLLEQIDVDAGADAGDRRRPTSPAVLYALCVELLKLSEQAPLVIVVDDIHDADPASLRCLAYLIRRVSSARVAIVLAERDQLSSRTPPSTPNCCTIPGSGGSRWSRCRRRRWTRWSVATTGTPVVPNTSR